MTNHSSRNRQAALLRQGIDITRAIMSGGSLSLIGDDPAHNGGVIARIDAALIAIDGAMRAYNADDNNQSVAVYREAEALRQQLRDSAAALVSRIAA